MLRLNSSIPDDECRQCNKKQREAHSAYWHARNDYRWNNLTREEVSRLKALGQLLGALFRQNFSNKSTLSGLGEERDVIEVFDYIAGTYACRGRQLPPSVHWSDTQLVRVFAFNNIPIANVLASRHRRASRACLRR